MEPRLGPLAVVALALALGRKGVDAFSLLSLRLPRPGARLDPLNEPRASERGRRVRGGRRASQAGGAARGTRVAPDQVQRTPAPRPAAVARHSPPPSRRLAVGASFTLEGSGGEFWRGRGGRTGGSRRGKRRGKTTSPGAPRARGRKAGDEAPRAPSGPRRLGERGVPGSRPRGSRGTCTSPPSPPQGTQGRCFPIPLPFGVGPSPTTDRRRARPTPPPVHPPRHPPGPSRP